MHPTQRFSNRVDDYVKYRPSYPQKILTDLQAAGIFTPQKTTIADIGSGTGLFGKLFADLGNTVYGVEPNPDMRHAAQKFLAHHPHFHPIDGSAEHTTLPDNAIDLITAAQAFHWFNPPQAKAEFHRILRPNRHILLVWNERKVEDSPFLQEYERLLQHLSPDYAKVDHRKVTESQMRDFLGHNMQTFRYDNAQHLDLPALKGRVLSSSYAPKEGPAHHALMQGIEKAFHQFQTAGQIAFLYDTKVYVAKIEK
ncbi:MAG: class I SAM-dependent methyltransferase [Phycisphaerae bacterium]